MSDRYAGATTVRRLLKSCNGSHLDLRGHVICGDALNSYAMLADEWIARDGVHTGRAHEDLVSGMAS